MFEVAIPLLYFSFSIDTELIYTCLTCYSSACLVSIVKCHKMLYYLLCYDVFWKAVLSLDCVVTEFEF